jgi:hypothetical protein
MFTVRMHAKNEHNFQTTITTINSSGMLYHCQPKNSYGHWEVTCLQKLTSWHGITCLAYHAPLIKQLPMSNSLYSNCQSLQDTHTHFDVSVSLSVPLHTNPTCMCWPNTYYYNLPAPGKVGFQDYNNQNLSIALG